ncbi:hypothetical protein CR513_56571, partial [Mucuna pruriens]
MVNFLHLKSLLKMLFLWLYYSQTTLKDNRDEHIVDEPTNNVQVTNEKVIEEEQEIARRRPKRKERLAFSSDYVICSLEHEHEMSIDKDLVSFVHAMKSDNYEKWLNLLEGLKQVGCKWVFKTKCDLNGKIERYKARFVVKDFTKKDYIDYKETFSPASKKDSLRIVLALVAHYDLELHQMDVNTVFLNDYLEENVYINQYEGFVFTRKESMVCKLKKSIYGLKQASKQ